MHREHYLIGEGALSSAVKEYKAVWGDSQPLIVADRNTWPIVGAVLREQFLRWGYLGVEEFVFPDVDDVYADYEHVVVVRELLQDNGLIAVAVGSGTINDIVKLASYECGKSYMVVPTAPSVDGYTAIGAAITVDGFKRTLDCLPPKVMVADVEVLRDAPYDMIAAGYGDLAAKIPAGADWIIADRLGVERILPEAWDMSQRDLRMRLADPAAIARREGAAIDGLFLGLVEVGFAMEVFKNSRPAAGAEHLMSHVWEMSHLSVLGFPISHGFKVAIGTLASTAVLTELFKLDEADLRKAFAQQPPITWPMRLMEIETFLGDDPTRVATIQASRAKFQDPQQLEQRRTLALGLWKDLKKDVSAQIIPFQELQDMFRIAGCPCEPADIGLTRAMFIDGMRKAQMIRERYTVLDFAYELGLLDTVIDIVAGGDLYYRNFLPA
jgi:glycerol-1-phosphate dehydrogenase [NAD(P)+]